MPCLKLKFEDFDIKDIETLTNTYNRIWTIVFFSTFDLEKLKINNFDSITIADTELTIEDAGIKKDSYGNYIFRFMNLPPNFELYKVTEYMTKEGFNKDEIIETVNYEHHNLPQLRNVKNGVIRCKVKCFSNDKLMENRIEPMSKKSVIGNYNVQINRIGEPKKCNHCNSTEHIRINCDVSHVACSICFSKSHLDKKCYKSYANSGKIEIHSDILNNDEYIESKGEFNKVDKIEPNNLNNDYLEKKIDTKKETDKNPKRNRSLNSSDNSKNKKEKKKGND